MGRTELSIRTEIALIRLVLPAKDDRETLKWAMTESLEAWLIPSGDEGEENTVTKVGALLPAEKVQSAIETFADRTLDIHEPLCRLYFRYPSGENILGFAMSMVLWFFAAECVETIWLSGHPETLSLAIPAYQSPLAYQIASQLTTPLPSDG